MMAPVLARDAKRIGERPERGDAEERGDRRGRPVLPVRRSCSVRRLPIEVPHLPLELAFPSAAAGATGFPVAIADVELRFASSTNPAASVEGITACGRPPSRCRRPAR